MTTTKDITYDMAWCGRAIIPKGTNLIPATNLPDGGYWADEWQNMSIKEESWYRNYGFHITENDL